MSAHLVTWLVGWTALLLAAPAAAEPDHRLSDRFFVGVGGGVARASGGEAVPVGGYETSFWPSDHLGLATVVALVGGEAATYDVGAQLVLAVPLRWIQPYAGALAGWRTTPDDVAARVHLLAGVNGYASRDLRVFAELRDPDITVIGATHATQVVVGVRWSPDWFHRARPVTKVDAVWWSTLLAVGAWTGATLAR